MRDLEEVLSRVFGDAHVFDDPLDGVAVGHVELAEELFVYVFGHRRPQLPRPSWCRLMGKVLNGPLNSSLWSG